MTSALLFGLISAFNIGNMIAMKVFQKGFKTDFSHFAWFNVVNAFFACLYFLVTNGFCVHMNGITFAFSVGFAITIVAYLALNILSFKFVSVAVVGVLATAGPIITSSLFGAVFLKEKLSARLIIAILLITVALILPFWKTGKKKTTVLGLLVCFGFSVAKGITVIITKLYAITPYVCDSNSFFFMTNIFILFASITAILCRSRVGNEKIAYFKLLSKKQIFLVLLQNVFSNLATVFTVVLLKTVDVSLFSVISSSVMLIAGGFIAEYIFHEKQNIKNWISVGLAVVSVICAGQI